MPVGRFEDGRSARTSAQLNEHDFLNCSFGTLVQRPDRLLPGTIFWFLLNWQATGPYVLQILKR